MTRNERFAVFQDLIVRSVDHHEAPYLRVAVSDAHGPRGTVTYTFVHEDERRASLAGLERWRDDATPLTFVRGATQGVLVDERRLLRQAFEDLDELDLDG